MSTTPSGPSGTTPRPGPTEGPRVSRDQVRDIASIRRPYDRRVAGVCSGLGRHLDIDPVILRVAFVVLGLFGGIGILVYGACWALIPDDGADRGPLGVSAQARSLLLLAVLGVGVMLIIGTAWDGPGIPWQIVVLALVGAVLLARRGPADPAGSAWAGSGHPPAAQPPLPPGADPWLTGDHTAGAQTAAGPVSLSKDAPATQAPASGSAPVPAPEPTAPMTYSPQARVQTAATAPPAASGAWPAAPAPAPGRPAPTAPLAARPVRPADPRRRGPLLFGPTLALVALAVGVLTAVDVSGAAIPAAAYPALATAVIGGMLLVGAWWGRAGGLIALGLVTALLTAGTTAVDAVATSTARYAPTSVVALQDTYQRPAGELVLDLTRIDSADLRREEFRNISVGEGVGRVEVVVPPDVRTRISAEVGLGSVDVLGRTDDGAGASVTEFETPTTTRGPDLVLHIQLGLGDIVVRHP